MVAKQDCSRSPSRRGRDPGAPYREIGLRAIHPADVPGTTGAGDAAGGLATASLRNQIARTFRAGGCPEDPAAWPSPGEPPTRGAGGSRWSAMIVCSAGSSGVRSRRT